jgi:hypothetical protein
MLSDAVTAAGADLVRFARWGGLIRGEWIGAPFQERLPLLVVIQDRVP